MLYHVESPKVFKKSFAVGNFWRQNCCREGTIKDCYKRVSQHQDTFALWLTHVQAVHCWEELEISWVTEHKPNNLIKQPTVLQAVWNSGVSPVLVQATADSVVSWHLSTYWLPDAGAFECWTPLFVTLKGIWQLLPIFMWALVLCLRDNFPEQHVMWLMKREVQSPLLTVGLETRMGAREVPGTAQGRRPLHWSLRWKR